jgi:hypothetical protein
MAAKYSDSMSQENVEVVKRFLGFGNFQAEALPDDRLSELFDPEVEWIPIPQGLLSESSYVGFEGIRRFSSDFFAAWDEMRVEPRKLRDAGAVVLADLRMRGRMREFEIDEVWSAVFTLGDGRIVRVQAIRDKG